ncbi:helix-turn-helix domain-containing protein [Actinomadura montaniterrae]|uniref:Helix-turn-helix transcriptional regulator n=1 Tax=Actinomadura montaniterrae TaxID=1803903 RepID=A0A6L3VLN6_9ACTN|nr:helix-turn-helix domain-containing protein [Actinomadura montaniterrae]KAB2373218.1 helix-turn-helix transcriptional regulator [Actinomadura montaniterrae]
MSPDGAPETIGQRIARKRKQRGLTQHGLAQRTSYSRSHIAQVEAGHKVATPAFIAAAAAALGVDPSQIYGQPFRTESPRDDRVHSAISDLRRALVFSDVAPDLDAPPRTLDQLTAEIATANRLRHAARHAQLAARLPAVIEELTWHAHEAESPRAWALLNKAHNLSASLTRRLGYNDLAGQIMERASVSARMSQDPHLPLMMTHRRALLMMNVAAYGPALRMLQRAVGDADTGRPDAVEVVGALHLRAAVVSARGRNAAAAWDHYAQAAEVSRRAGGPSLDTHGSDFNPGNIAIHGAAIALELGDLDEAVRRDQRITDRTVAGMAAERRGHHEIDMSRVHVEAGDYDRALKRLLRAEKAAPQMTRYHPSARAVATHIGHARRTLPEPLRGLLNRMHA